MMPPPMTTMSVLAGGAASVSTRSMAGSMVVLPLVGVARHKNIVAGAGVHTSLNTSLKQKGAGGKSERAQSALRPIAVRIGHGPGRTLKRDNLNACREGRGGLSRIHAGKPRPPRARNRAFAETSPVSRARRDRHAQPR